MMDGIEVRESVADDLAAIEALYPEAFPDEDLLPLVRELLQLASLALSLVGVTGPVVAGHVVFTTGGLVERDEMVALLGPLAVAPAWQRRGVGSALVRAGLHRLDMAGVTDVYVLGDPAYYGRFGFLPEIRVAPPYPLPAEWRGAWQSMRLRDTGLPPRGTLSLPRPWLNPALWAP